MGERVAGRPERKRCGAAPNEAELCHDEVPSARGTMRGGIGRGRAGPAGLVPQDCLAGPRNAYALTQQRLPHLSVGVEPLAAGCLVQRRKQVGCVEAEPAQQREQQKAGGPAGQGQGGGVSTCQRQPVQKQSNRAGRLPAALMTLSSPGSPQLPPAAATTRNACDTGAAWVMQGAKAACGATSWGPSCPAVWPNRGTRYNAGTGACGTTR